jgi:hypothetical protein
VGIELLASLGLLFFKCAAYMLTAAFVAHFTLRAFWVATIGLLSVFPQDIEYDRLPKLGDHAKKAMRIQLGTFQSFIVRLDRTCSTLLSIAFLIALSIANISIIYLAMFILLSFVRLVVPIGIMEEYEVVLYFVFLALTLLPAVFMGLGNTKWAKKRPDLETRLFRWQWAATGILFPFTRDPFTRLGYMFQSNISRSAYNRYKLLIGVTLSVLLLFFKLQHDAGNRLDTRTYYGTDEPYRVYPVHYDNLRTKGSRIITSSCSSRIPKCSMRCSVPAGPNRYCPITCPGSRRGRNAMKPIWPAFRPILRSMSTIRSVPIPAFCGIPTPMPTSAGCWPI